MKPEDMSNAELDALLDNSAQHLRLNGNPDRAAAVEEAARRLRGPDYKAEAMAWRGHYLTPLVGSAADPVTIAMLTRSKKALDRIVESNREVEAATRNEAAAVKHPKPDKKENA